MKQVAIRFGFLALILFAGIACVAQERWISSPAKAIADLETHWLQHIDDPTVLDSILADDFVHTLPSGFITKQQQIDFAKAHPRTPQEERHFEDFKVRVYGDTGIANGIVVTTDASGTHRTVFTDIFVKRNGKWQAVNAQENPEQPRR
ncbi:MAG: nuclear transport factor 2 family protein [Acidobacteriaceae bacterium]